MRPDPRRHDPSILTPGVVLAFLILAGVWAVVIVATILALHAHLTGDCPC